MATQWRREYIADRWDEGAQMREIAEELGSTPNSINVEMVHMRADGWVLPYRYPGNAARLA